MSVLFVFRSSSSRHCWTEDAEILPFWWYSQYSEQNGVD